LLTGPDAAAGEGMNASTSPLQHGEQARLVVALRSVALAGGPMIFAQGEQRRLYSGGCRLSEAKRDQVAPQMAAAVDLDEAGQGYGGKPGRLCGDPFLPALLRLQAVQAQRSRKSDRCPRPLSLRRVLLNASSTTCRCFTEAL
jgi:hypothetical protein